MMHRCIAIKLVYYYMLIVIWFIYITMHFIELCNYRFFFNNVIAELNDDSNEKYRVFYKSNKFTHLNHKKYV